MPPVERMLADDRDVFVPAYPSGSYQEQIDAIREGTIIVLPGRPGQPLHDIDWSEAEFEEYYTTKLHGWSGLAQLLGSPDRLPEDVENAVAFVIRDWFSGDGLPPGISPRAWWEGTLVMRLSAILLAIDYYRAHGGLGPLAQRLERVAVLVLARRSVAADVHVAGSHHPRRGRVNMV